jgi:hypothetical protein
MAAMKISFPKFREAQQVYFMGGEGTVRSYKLESGSWTYLVEMTQGPEPEFGRVGAETKIFLPESDLLNLI